MVLFGNMKIVSGCGEMGEIINYMARVYKMVRRLVMKLREKENCVEFVEKCIILRNVKCLLDGFLKRNGR